MFCAIMKIVERGTEEAELGPAAFEVFERRGGMRLHPQVGLGVALDLRGLLRASELPQR